ncbi:MAG: UDP-N-acetylmuramoyl-tripeptide--D-alanyl-D-alanine ligase [Lentisphaerae bacterium]|nr:UDP-N-acetylmuramoyl-tripeptide--D-alanyl-D-alanine ligase [Lentisphaerota bacterium]
MSALWFSWDDLRRITGGDWLAPGPRPQSAAGVSAVCDDSRAIRPGALFMAIRGEAADGHRFVASAAAAGAGAVCVCQDPDAETLAALRSRGCPVLRVADTLAAFQRLAREHRRSMRQVVVVGITGSCGKTSTKEMLAAVLARRYPGAVLKTEGNTNNHFGVPRNLLRLEAGHRAAVIEMGTNHPGEIAALARLAEPDLGVVSTIGAAHLEYFGDLAGVAREKGDLLALTAGTGIAVLPCEAAHADILRAKAGSRRVVTFGTGPGADVVVAYEGLCGAGAAFTLSWPREGRCVRVEWPLVGAHQALNAGAAAAVGRALGLSPEEIALGLGQTALPAMRLERRTVAGVNWVNDAYNANPDSMRAGIESFLELSAAAAPVDRVMVLGDMLEQGPLGQAAHRELLRWVAERAGGAAVIPIGALMAAAAAEIGLDAYPDAAAAAAVVRGGARPGRWIFVKGSRGLHLEALLPPREEADR